MEVMRNDANWEGKYSKVPNKQADRNTLLYFFKFVSRANNSKSCPPNVTQKTKAEAIDIFLQQTTLHTCGF